MKSGSNGYRPKHANSTGAVVGSALSVLVFEGLAWLWPETPAPPPALIGAVQTLAIFACSQAGPLFRRRPGEGG